MKSNGRKPKHKAPARLPYTRGDASSPLLYITRRHVGGTAYVYEISRNLDLAAARGRGNPVEIFEARLRSLGFHKRSLQTLKVRKPTPQECAATNDCGEEDDET